MARTNRPIQQPARTTWRKSFNPAAHYRIPGHAGAVGFVRSEGGPEGSARTHRCM